MATQNKAEIKGITSLATKLANKELKSGGQEHPAELLDALSTVANALGQRAGGDVELMKLAAHVQEIVEQSKSTKSK